MESIDDAKFLIVKSTAFKGNIQKVPLFEHNCISSASDADSILGYGTLSREALNSISGTKTDFLSSVKQAYHITKKNISPLFRPVGF